MMNIAIVGTGYVGLVTGACFAELGLTVYCVDKNEEKIEQLKRGEMPIYEPGLDTLVCRNVEARRLHFFSSLPEVLPKVDVVFIAVGTPPTEDGSADLQAVLQVARTIGQNMSQYKLVVTKSTVPVGTCNEVKNTIAHELAKRKLASLPFDVASNPEFLKEGDAIADFMKPDRVVVGGETERAKKMMAQLYRPMLLSNFRVIFMDIASSEMTKYAANAKLATRISFMNSLAGLCELVGADITHVRKGMGSDSRIGSKFLYAGCGYGGSCFPKDVKALIQTANSNNYSLPILEAVERVNSDQKNILFRKFISFFCGNVVGRKVLVWGLAYKPGTDDMREAPSLVLIEQLLQAGCHVTVYDPVAMNEASKRLGNQVSYANDMYEGALGCDAVFHVTEWKEFRMPQREVLYRLMKTPLLIDGRNVFDRHDWPGFTVLQIGINA